MRNRERTVRIRLFITVAAMLVMFISCKNPMVIKILPDNTGKKPVTYPVTSIAVTKQPDKTEYALGESLDITGLVVTATYSNGSTGIVAVTAENITGFDSSIKGEKTLTVTYGGQTITFTVTVTDNVIVIFKSLGGTPDPEPQIVARGDKVTAPPVMTKTNCTFGGWYKELTHINEWNFDVDEVNEPTTLYAKWTMDDAVKIKMVRVPAGTFQMGTADPAIEYQYERPQHTVTLSSAFYMGMTEVTQAQYEAVIGTNPSYHTTANGRPPAAGETDENRPVEMVNWYKAWVFCNRLSMMEGLTPAYRINNSTDPADWGDEPYQQMFNPWNDGITIDSGSNGYRLPTEAQWEYAAKGGNGSPGNYTYAGSNNYDDVAWYYQNSGGTSGITHEVAAKKPNSLGLYDMSGNAFEWCWDKYGAYSSGAQTDPMGPNTTGSPRVSRGGGGCSGSDFLRSASRTDGYTTIDSGFRLARPYTTPTTTVISSIAVIRTPDKTVYKIGEPLITTGLVVTAAYSDSTIEAVTAAASITGFDSVTAGTKTITVTHGGQTTTFTVTVTDIMTVTFAPNGGTPAPAQRELALGSMLTAPAAMTRAGFTFDAWYKEAAFTNKWDFAVDTVTQDITLYAKWMAEIPGMVYVPGGSFDMGKNLGPYLLNGDVTPVHKVNLSGFYIGKYEVTQAQWLTVMGRTIAQQQALAGADDTDNGRGGTHPIYYVNWYDALVFCNTLSMTEGLTPAYRIGNSTDPTDWGPVPTSTDATWNAVTIDSGSTGYRLPTEAQWEFAAKGGNLQEEYPLSGDYSSNIDLVAWHGGNSGNKAQPVGTKAPNGLGIYDMSGNAFEWCWDWFGNYSSTEQSDPTGAATGTYRTLRGGSWNFTTSNINYFRVVYRDTGTPSLRRFNYGFRLVRP